MTAAAAARTWTSSLADTEAAAPPTPPAESPARRHTPSYERMMDSTRSSRARSRAESRDPGAVLADPGAVLAARYKRIWADPGAVLAARYKSVWGGARSE